MEILAIWAVMAVVGALIASGRGGSALGGCLLGAMLGPIGWLIALFVGPSRQPCPHCGERVRKGARVCPHCQRELTSVTIPASAMVTANGASTSTRGRISGGVAPAPLFSKPNLGASPVAYVPPGTIFDVLDARGVFVSVRIGGQVQGWLHEARVERGHFDLPAPSDKTCPRCAETVKAAAKVCRFCGHDFEAAPRA